jgi:hypothetical protein
LKHDLDMLSSVFDCPNVRSIGIHVYHEYEVTLRRLKDVLLSCPNLEGFDILIAPRDIGIANEASILNDFTGFDVEEGEKTAPLKKLRITNEDHSLARKILDIKLLSSGILDLTQLVHLELRGNFHAPPL